MAKRLTPFAKLHVAIVVDKGNVFAEKLAKQIVDSKLGWKIIDPSDYWEDEENFCKQIEFCNVKNFPVLVYDGFIIDYEITDLESLKCAVANLELYGIPNPTCSNFLRDSNDFLGN